MENLALFPMYTLAGGLVGFIVGITGIGGGALMTPLLLMFGFPPHIAIGTDLLYAAITKSGGVYMHHRQKTINWRIVLTMAAGSIPAAIVVGLILQYFYNQPEHYNSILTSSLGVMLTITAVVILYNSRLKASASSPIRGLRKQFLRFASPITVTMGLLLGTLVTLSSVGAGAFGTAILMLLYPRLKGVKIVGTDLAHAVPLTLVGGLVHMSLGHVDYVLLAALLCGSLPAIYFGTKVGKHLPNQIMLPILATLLFIIGIKYTFFS